MSSPDKRKVSTEHEENGCKRIKPPGDEISQDVRDTQNTFRDFVVDKVLNEHLENKAVFVQGHFKGREGNAVVIVEKTPFVKESLGEILCEESETNCTLKNDIYGTLELFPPKEFSAVKTTLVYPATEKHIAKYQSQDIFLIEESSDDYKNITLPYLEAEQFSIQWVYNILEKKQEADRIVFEDEDPENGFILLPDMKWDRKTTDNLYLVAIVQKHGIKSLRDLHVQHLPLLRNILKKGLEAIEKQYGVPQSKLRVYLHYQPSYYHLHVHFTHLHFLAPGSGVERAHLLSDVIENLEMDNDFYQKKTLAFTVRDGEKLCKKFREAARL